MYSYTSIRGCRAENGVRQIGLDDILHKDDDWFSLLSLHLQSSKQHSKCPDDIIRYSVQYSVELT